MHSPLIIVTFSHSRTSAFPSILVWGGENAVVVLTQSVGQGFGSKKHHLKGIVRRGIN